jgi:hypothetical protein
MHFSPPTDDHVVLEWGRAAYLINGGLQILLIPIGWPVALLTPPITSVAGCFTVLTLGLLSLLFIIMWVPLAMILLGTSWAYKNVWPFRPVVVPLGFLFAVVGFVYASWMPSYGDIFAREHRLKMSMWWPLSLELEDPTWPAEDGDRASDQGRQSSGD